MAKRSASAKIWLGLGMCLMMFAGLVWLSHRRAGKSLQAWKARMITQGERFGIDELAPPAAPLDMRVGELIGAANRLGRRSFKPAAFLWLHFNAQGEARLPWMETNFVGYTRATSTWTQVTAELALAREDLNAIREAVRQPANTSVASYRAPVARTFMQKREAAQWLTWDVLGQLRAEDLPAAQSDLLALARLSRLHQDDLTLVNQMIRVAIAGLGFEVTWAALQSPGWTEAQLAGLQEEWEPVVFLEKLPRTIEMERAQILELFEDARTNGLRRARAGGRLPPGGGGNFKAILEKKVFDPIWRLAWAEQDEMFYLESMQRTLDAIRQACSTKSWVSVSGEFNATYDGIEARLSAFDSFRYSLSGMTLANARRAWEIIMRQETQRSLMLAAIALQRYQLRHSKFPPDLEALVPEFLAAVPVDYMNGQSLHYHSEPDGSFRLYSVGLDGKDDGGNPEPAAAWKRFSSLFDGRDAVWPRLASREPRLADADLEPLPLVQFALAPMADVVRTLAREGDLKVRIDPSVELEALPAVTIRLTNLTALEVLETILKSNHLVLVRHSGTNLVGITAK